MAPKPRKQHYVPKGYLKRFANAKGKTYIYDKIKNEVRQANIADICCEKEFYTLPKWDEVKEFYEDIGLENENFESFEELEKFWDDGYYFESNYLSPIDDYSKKTVDKILIELKEKNTFPMDLLGDVFRIIINQSLRTKKGRLRLANIADALFKTMSKAKGEDIDDLKLTYSDNYLKQRQINTMQNDEILDNLLSCLAGCYLSVCRNSTKWGFFTSDHPVAVYANDNGFYGGAAFCSYGVEIYFPISDEYCICLADVRYLSKELGGDIEFLKKSNGMIINASMSNVLRINHLIVRNSNNIVISKFSQFNLMEKILKERPEDLKSNIGVTVGGLTEGTIYKDATIKRGK